MLQTPIADYPELQVTEDTILWKGEVMTCGECQSPLPPSAFEPQDLMFLGADEEGPTFIFQRCYVCWPDGG